MRIVIQGSLTPRQLGEAVSKIVENTLEKAEAKGKKYVLHNPVIETNLNVQGQNEPVLIIDDERQTMLTVHTGIEKGELTEYKEVDRTELLEKFHEVTDGILEKAEKESE